MGLETVKVPPEMEGLFAQAEKLVSRYFQERRDDPRHGTIEIFGERYVLVRAASLSVEFFHLVRDLYGAGREREAEDFARNILFDLAHAIGRSDARNFHAKMGLVDPIAKLSAGPVHFAYAGWAFVDISPASRPAPDESYCLVYDHPYSFESDAWLRAGQRRDFPACVMSSGYSSGWCEESFGVKLVASEILCRAKGDDCCRFIMAHPERIEGFVSEYLAREPHLAPRVRGYPIPDFFARKRIEEELRRSHDELEQRVAERTAALTREMAERQEIEAQLRQAGKLEAIGRLAGGIAHDFNNLMAIVLTRASRVHRLLAADDPLRAELEEIRKAADRAAALTKQLLAFGRVHTLERQVLDLNAVVADLGRTLVPLVGEHIELVVRLADGAGHIEADRSQIEQVLMNLVVNARDAMPGGGVLTVATAAARLDERQAVTTGELAPGAYAVLGVGDTGAGMSPETLARVFDPFFTTKPDGQGTGLGLSTVYGVVRHAGGGIAVASAPGQGAQFTLYFPAAARPAVAPCRAEDAGTTPGGVETVLLVEDQDELRRCLQDVLVERGYTVLSAGGSHEALALVERTAAPIDLLVTDLVMPRMNGRELSLRVSALRPGVKVLYISGYAPETIFAGGAEGAGAPLLPKPFRPEELARKVREVLDRR